jgi:TonB family protein
VRAPRATLLDRAPTGVLLLGALFASALIHATAVRAAAAFGRRGDARPARAEDVRVALVDRPEPPPPPPPTPAVPMGAPKPRFVRTHAPAPAAAPPSPSPQPPAPTPAPAPADAPPAAQPPVLMPGVSLSATTAVGGMGVRVGDGGRVGGGGGRAAGGGEGEPAGTKPVAPGYALTEEPVFLDNVSAADIRRYYPEEARKAKVEGAVRMRLLVDDDGTVARASVLADPTSMFARAAMKVARLYRFKPAKIDGRRVATEIEFTIHFELD